MNLEFKHFPMGTMQLEEFHRLYEISFHKKNDYIVPAEVIVIYDDNNYAGFMDLSIISKTTTFVRFIGFAKFNPIVFRYVKETFNYIHSLGYTSILGTIEAKNKLALIWALRQGFYPHGFKYMGDDVSIVEIRKDRNGSTGSYKRGL